MAIVCLAVTSGMISGNELPGSGNFFWIWVPWTGLTFLPRNICSPVE